MFQNLDVTAIIIILVVIFFSTALHELMHAYVALRLGDDLAHSRGRISLNPLVHIDPFLTILLPLLLLVTTGTPLLAAKPVPINTSRLKGGEMGMAIVGVAGPLTNLALAVLAAGVIRLVGTGISGLPAEVLGYFFIINIGLFVFNMIPFPPLDGSRLLYAFAPEPVQKVMQTIEGFGVFGVIILITVFASVISPVLLSVETGLARLLIG